jgi:hypothetical protein
MCWCVAHLAAAAAACSEGGKPVAGRPITFTITAPGGRTIKLVANTDSKGVARIPQTRRTPTEATITAAATSSKTNLPVVSNVPVQIIWYSDAPEQLQLNIGLGTRVLVSTNVPVTATYTGGRSCVKVKAAHVSHCFRCMC